MKTIKIIDLLNMISKGEEVPRAINFEGHEYWYNETEEDYYEGFGFDYEYLFKNLRTCWLNDEVEILEEPKKIPKKLEDYDFDDSLDANTKCECLRERMQEIENQLDEIIDYLLYFKSKGE